MSERRTGKKRQEQRATEAAEELLAALAHLRKTTRATEASLRRALKLSADGAGIPSVLELASPARQREAMNEALRAVEESRHQMRLRVFELGLQSGLSIADLGRAFGFSRQLAARYAKEVAAGS